MTPLMWASFKGYLDIVNVLIDEGANINDKNKVSLTMIQDFFALMKNIIVWDMLTYVGMSGRKFGYCEDID